MSDIDNQIKEDAFDDYNRVIRSFVSVGAYGGIEWQFTDWLYEAEKVEPFDKELSVRFSNIAFEIASALNYVRAKQGLKLIDLGKWFGVIE